MEPLCFICGTNINNDTAVSPKQIANLKRLLIRLCEVLSVTTIATTDWNFTSSIGQSICCVNCYDLIQNVERVHDIIVKTEKQLKTYLCQVKSLVAKSEDQISQESLWSPSCLELRRTITKRSKSSNDNEVDLLNVHVKEEYCTEISNADDWHVEDGFDQDLPSVEPHHDPGYTNESLKVSKAVPVIENSDINYSSDIVKEEPNESIQDHSNLEETSNHEESNKLYTTNRKPESTTSAFTGKRRKIKIINDDETLESLVICRRKSSRRAKTDTEKALQLYASTSSINDDGDNGEDYHDHEDYDVPKGPTDTEVGGDTDIQLSPKKKRGRPRKLPRPIEPKKTRKWDYNPFVVAAENLYLYRWGTFVRNTYTHLKCEAYDCTFETEFDYFPSFQIMKKHIDKNHCDTNYQQNTKHPCVFCNTMHDNRDKLQRHIQGHEQLRSGNANAVCECCLITKSQKYIRTHLFIHKNDQEKAAAIAANDCTYKNKQIERLMTEKKFKCDFENCTSAFKSSGNLIRHKHIHLPKELRTDHVICTECGQRMVKHTLADHMRRVHHPETVDRVTVCPICDKRFLPKDKCLLQKHIRQHKGEKPFLCTECGQSYVDNAGLIAHMKHMHTEQTPTPCDWCGRVYNKLKSLDKHVRTKHPEKLTIKKYIKKKFQFYNNQATELEKASFIGPIQQFPCSICEVVCKYRFTLKKHMRLHNIKHVEGNFGMRTISSRQSFGTKKKFETVDESSVSSTDEGQSFQRPTTHTEQR